MEMHTAGSLQRIHGLTFAPAPNGAGNLYQTILNAAARITAGARAMAAAWRRSLHKQRAMAQLEQMDDLMLADIGLTRSEIPHAVRCEGRWQHATPDKPRRDA
jgi:uncharacterized protein YjiS (DUF1127 family)